MIRGTRSRGAGRGRANRSLAAIAGEAKQSIARHNGWIDCSVACALRNDGVLSFRGPGTGSGPSDRHYGIYAPAEFVLKWLCVKTSRSTEPQNARIEQACDDHAHRCSDAGALGLTRA